MDLVEKYYFFSWPASGVVVVVGGVMNVGQSDRIRSDHGDPEKEIQIMFKSSQVKMDIRGCLDLDRSSCF